MSVLETINNLNNNSRATARTLPGSNGQQQRPKADVWLNVGYEANGRFVSLPLGLPIDTMDEIKVSKTSDNEDWKQFSTARNELLTMLQKAGAEMQPGQEETLNLTIKLRRVKEETEVDPTTNPYAIGNVVPFGSKTEAEPEAQAS